eukprot:3509609-Alexandrium_andersonii.AAC.1
MSASLVGSEMCIRDRKSGVRRGGPEPSDPGRGAQRFRRARRRPRHSKLCLLYTSDAADDM